MSDIFEQLRDKLDKMVKGYPKMESGDEILFLKEYFSAEDAELFIAMRPGWLTPAEVAADIEEDVSSVAQRLESMAQRGLLFRVRTHGDVRYRTVPVIHGFLELNLNYLPEKGLKHFNRYFVKGRFAKTLHDYDVPLARTIPVQTEVVAGKHVLPMDDAISIIKSHKIIGVADCFCRKSAARIGRGCKHSLETCLVFGYFAQYYVENKIGRYISPEEAIEIIKKSEKEGMVIQVANSQSTEFMCSCCSCSCGVLISLNIFDGPSREFQHNYICQRDDALCNNDGICTKRCPVGAFKLVEDKVQFRQERCIGCGLCVTTCPTKALSLIRKPDDKVYLPQNETLFDTYEEMGRKHREAKGIK